MAKGKHATKSANRRQSAERDHIDRLTDQLVEAKARARRYEADAMRLPSVEAELRKVRAERDAGASPEAERLTAMVQKMQGERDTAVDDYRSLQKKWERFLERYMDTQDGTGTEKMEALAPLLGEDGDLGFTLLTEIATRRGLLGPEAVRRIQRARGIRS